MKDKKAIIISTSIVVLLLLVVGVTYAFFTYESGTKSEIVTGQIYMNYEETSTISLTGVFPETKAQALARTDENGVFEFTITGRNTSQYPVYYEIDLLEGGVITGKTETSTKILPDDVRIYLERDGEVLVDGLTYKDWNNRRIYVDTVPANQVTNIEHKYTLRMWIDENVTISDTDPNADYTTAEWNDSYTSLKVRVVGDFEEKTMPTAPTAAETIIASLGSNGLVAVADDGGLYTGAESQVIREYRYSGSNDVVTNNYVSFNGDLWRIIGVFPTENEDGTTENLIKIIKATTLGEYQWSSDDGKDYSQSLIKNDLNDETEGSESYYNSIDSIYQEMIQETTYYLGNIRNEYPVAEIYNQERATRVTSGENEVENIFPGNDLLWTGKIGLMYSSDYGYAADNAYWETNLRNYDLAKDSNWLFQNSYSQFTISLADFEGRAVYPSIHTDGYIFASNLSSIYYVSPVLYLKSDVTFSGGTGIEDNPYMLG